MRTLKGWITTSAVAAILLTSVTYAQAGIIIAQRESCPAPEKVESVKSFGGIIIAQLTGIIIAQFGGIIIAQGSDFPTDPSCTL